MKRVRRLRRHGERRKEVEAIVDDYLSMLASELAGTAYTRRSLRARR
jgi:hypothetical protein